MKIQEGLSASGRYCAYQSVVHDKSLTSMADISFYDAKGSFAIFNIFW